MTRLILCALLAAGFACAQGRVYELRTYTCEPGKLEALKARFRDHTVRIFSRHGMVNVGYWVPDDPEKSTNTLVYLISHSSRQAATKNWTEFRADPEWQKVQKESEAAGKIVQKIDSLFLNPTDFSQLK
jgi:hypothetical protein